MKKQTRKGKHIAAKIPAPTVREHNGVRVIVQQVDDLTAAELLDLSEFYRTKYGDTSERVR